MTTIRIARVPRLVALVVVAVVGLAVAFVVVPARPAAAAQANGPAWEQFRLTNADRAANGLGALQMDPNLVDVAQTWANHLAAARELTHNPNYVAQLSAAVGGAWTRVGENIGYARTPAEVEAAFLASPAHRANLLGAFNYVGIGSAYGADGYLWVVVDFVASPVAQPVVTPPPVMPAAEAVPLVDAAYHTFFGRAPSSSAAFYWASSLVIGKVTVVQFLRALATSTTWAGRLVTSYYEDTLGRQPDPGGLAFWVGEIRRGVPTAVVASAFYGSTEYFRRAGGTAAAWITSLYVALLGRGPDPTGLASRVTELVRDVSTDSIARHFYQSHESLVRRVNLLYEELLGRAADAGGLQYWCAKLGRTGNDVELAVSLAASPEYLHRAMAAYPY